MRQRPAQFWIDRSHPFAKGSVFAGLGQTPGTSLYRDDSLYKNHGTLTGYTGAGNTPADRWKLAIGRSALTSATGDTVVFPAIIPASYPWSLSCWAYPTTGARYLVCDPGPSSPPNFVLQISAAANWEVYLASASPIVSTAAKVGVWQHVALVAQSASSVTFFVNGVSFACSGAGAAPSISAVWLFNRAAGSRLWLGMAADLIVANRAWSVGDIGLLSSPVRSTDYDGALCWLRGREQVWMGSAAPAANRRRRFLALGV